MKDKELALFEKILDEKFKALGTRLDAFEARSNERHTETRLRVDKNVEEITALKSWQTSIMAKVYVITAGFGLVWAYLAPKISALPTWIGAVLRT